jgi:methylenetetrahydrofolate reductase (NADPH)
MAMVLDATKRPPQAPARSIARAAAELVASGSIEIGAHHADEVQGVAALLPVHTPVYVNALPRQLPEETLEALVAIRRAGLEPIPHVAARRLGSRAEARGFLERAVADAGVRRVLLIAGDASTTAGPYPDSAAVLRERLLADAGIREVGLAGYPEGHPRIAGDVLRRALEDKHALAAAQGMSVFVTTQFTFAPQRIVDYCVALEAALPGVPVYAGLAGPTSPRQLLRYAQRCGVSASLRAIEAQGLRAIRALVHTDPTEQLMLLARHAAAIPSLVGVHLYSFGGAERTARWMNERLRSG